MPECAECGKTFDSDTGLEQHKKDKHDTEQAASQPKKKSRKWFMIGVVVIVLVGAGAYVLLSAKPAYEPGPAELHIKGAGTAEIVEFSDFQCPACGAAYRQVKEFLQSSGDEVRFVYKHYPLIQIHPYAFKAAEASECAADQGKFWEYHDKLFENQLALQTSNLVKYAEQIGLDAKNFSACLNSGVIAGRVTGDMAEADSRGVQATPTFFINGKKVEGVLTPAQFAQEIGI